MYVAVGVTGLAASGDSLHDAMERFIDRHGAEESIVVYDITAHLQVPEPPERIVLGEPDE